MTAGHFANFIEKDSALIGLHKSSLTAFISTGEGTFFMPEKFGLQQCFGEGRAIDRHQRIISAGAVNMQGPCNQLFTGTTFAGYQYRRFGRGRHREHIQKLFHGLAFSDDIGDVEIGPKLFFEHLVFGSQSGVVMGTFQGQFQHFKIKRLYQIVIGPGF